MEGDEGEDRYFANGGGDEGRVVKRARRGGCLHCKCTAVEYLSK